MQIPELSVVLSVYNGGKKLTATIESICTQQGVDFEFIIVNDGSSDASGDLLNAYAEKNLRIRSPGSPWENGYNERFSGTLRREALNAEWFSTTKQAQIVINQWLRQYNHIRPHQALNVRPPIPETLLTNGP